MRLLNRIKLGITTIDEWDLIFVGMITLLFVWAIAYTSYYFSKQHPELKPIPTIFAITSENPVKQTFTDQNPILEN